MKRRHRSLSVVCTVTGLLATGFGLFALSQSATAHTPNISASCSGVTLSASSYDGNYQNVWSVTIDGATTSGTFGNSLQQTFPVPQDHEFTWSGHIAAFDGAYAQDNSGTLGPCVTPTEPPTTTPPTTTPPTTTPPTTTPPTTTPPTTPPPTEEPTTEPPTTPPTTPPPTTTPPTTPPPTEPTTTPPTTPPTTTPPPTPPPTTPPTTPPPTEPTTEPPTTEPTTVLDETGTRGPDESDVPGGNDGNGDNPGGGVTLPDTGAPVSAAFTVDEGMVPLGVARASLAAGLLLLLLGSWQLWRRDNA